MARPSATRSSATLIKDQTDGYELDEMIFASMSGLAVILCGLISVVDRCTGGRLA